MKDHKLYQTKIEGSVKRTIILFVGLVFVFACKKDKKTDSPPVTLGITHQIQIFPSYGSDSLYLDSVYQTTQGYDVKFTELKLFCSQIGNSGGDIAVESALFDYRYSKNQFCTFSTTVGFYPNLSGYLGIDSINNHSDPSAFPIESPLNILNANDMHWGWNPGYIFLKIEARVDTVANGIANFDHNVVFHVGNDVNRMMLQFQNIPWKTEGQQQRARIKYDLAQFLTGLQAIDLKSEFSSHSAPGQEILSLKIIQNVAASLSFLP